MISAKTQHGLDQLTQKLAEMLNDLYQEVELFFPKASEHLIFELSRNTVLTKREPASLGTVCRARLTSSALRIWQDYIVKKEL